MDAKVKQAMSSDKGAALQCSKLAAWSHYTCHAGFRICALGGRDGTSPGPAQPIS